MKKLAIMAALMSLTLGICAVAQEAGADAKEGKRKAKAERARRGPDRGGMKMSPRMMDANKDMLVSKEEIAAAMPELKKKIEEAQKKLLETFDADKDGKLNEEELKKVKEMMAVLEVCRMVQQVDKDKDMTLSDEELAGLQKRYEMMAEKMNNQVLERYDANKDGAVSEEEMKAAREKMRKGRGAKERKRKGKEAEGNQL